MEQTAGERRVLVVDDEEKCRHHLQELLGLHGFAVTGCGDSGKILPMLKAQAYHVVLLDIRMPGIEGTDMLPLIKKQAPDLPVILVSAFCDDRDSGYYRSLGAFEAIAKPFSPETLVETITRAIDQQERIPMTLTSLSIREGRDLLYRKLILTALRKANWNQLRAAKQLGISRYCLMRWIKKLGISYS